MVWILTTKPKVQKCMPVPGEVTYDGKPYNPVLFKALRSTGARGALAKL